MYLHLGQNTVIRQSEIIGVFDIESTTVCKNTRDFLSKAEKQKKVINVSYDLPKAFIVCAGQGTGENRVYITPISAQTLKKRIDSGVASELYRQKKGE
ncbi:MAG: DUF370 domain-containing protein [Clostridia bacterium]|nr:DUF370 domain-containing protein [Clostridia bacterium]